MNDPEKFKTIAFPVSPNQFVLVTYDDSTGSTPLSVEIALPKGWALLGDATYTDHKVSTLFDLDQLFPEEAGLVLEKACMEAAGIEIMYYEGDPRTSDFTWLKGFLIVKEEEKDLAMSILLKNEKRDFYDRYND